jgi:AAA+ ATPase superfamily predicted ATPase
VLINPFTPTEIASQPEDFYGRKNELETLERCLAKGSVLIHGPMGIGKSSLMARVRLEMEGFGSEHRATSIVLVGNKSIASIDDAARCLVQEMLSIDQQASKIKFSFGSLFEFENSEVVRTSSKDTICP